MPRNPRCSRLNITLRRLVINAATHDRYPKGSVYSNYLHQWLRQESESIWKETK
jgi:hypothetical protein